MSALTGFTSSAFGSGFALIEQSVSGMGTAYAGGAAVAEDASTVYFNPAGMSFLCDDEVLGGYHVVIPLTKFKNRGSIINPTVAALAGVSSTMTGGNGGDAGEDALVGHFYAVKQVNDRLSFGFGSNTPFGLITDYNGGWVGRYHADRSAVLTINLNPCASYKVLPCLSIGAGLNIMYLHAKLSNNVDYGTIAWANSVGQPGVQAGLTAAGFLPQTQDGRVEVKGNSWGYGGNVGILWEPRCDTRLGLHYRSDVRQRVKGVETFSSLPEFVENPASSGGLEPFFEQIKAGAGTNATARANIVLPGTLSFSLFHQYTPCIAFVADYSWTRWSKIEELRFFFNTAQSDGVTTLKWRNTSRASVGMIYSPNCRWKLRTGFAYDQSPITSKELRTPRIPGQDRYWLAFGVGYQLNNCLKVDIGYAHLFVPTPKIDKTAFDLSEDDLRGGLKGTYYSSTEIVSAQAVYSF